MRRAVNAVLLVLVGTLLLGGCGLPDDNDPRLIAAGDAPLDLAPSTVPPTAPGPADDTVAVFFMNRDTGLLAAVARPVTELTPQAAIEQLLAGVMPDDPPALASSIPPATELLGATIDQATSTITLELGPVGEGGIQSVSGDQQVQAFAQLVRTATGQTPLGIRFVLFRVGGEPFPAALPEAGASTDPVSRDDYASLDPAGG